MFRNLFFTFVCALSISGFAETKKSTPKITPTQKNELPKLELKAEPKVESKSEAKVEAKKVATPVTPSSETLSNRTGFFLIAGADYNFLSFPSYITSVTNRMSLAANLEVDYFFHPNFGAFIDFNYGTRGLQGNTPGNDNTAPFLDIPFGVSINTGGFTENSRSHVNLGLFYSIPLADALSNPSTLGASLNGGKLKGALGMYLSYQAMFALMDHLGMGFKVYGKVPFSTNFDTPSALNGGIFYEAGAGIVFTLW